MPTRKTVSNPVNLAKVLFLGALIQFVSASGTQPAAPGSDGTPCKTAPEARTVQVTTTHEGNATHFNVRNDEFCEVTMTFDLGLVNLKSDVQFPYTTTLPPRQVTEAFTISPVDPGAKWEYSYTNYYKLGSQCARHDDSWVYQLPYAPGEKFKVTQGYNGKYSHKGSNQYAIDWQMPEGTLVHAARGGVVARVKDDSDKGGASIEFDWYNNYVLIRHDDGTLGHYCHLKKGSCLVKVGQTVAAGDIIARSGNTGFSSGPHLHFCVFKTKSGRERVSIPVQFQTAADKATTLASGRAYRAAGLQTASAGATREPGRSVGAAVQ